MPRIWFFAQNPIFILFFPVFFLFHFFLIFFLCLVHFPYRNRVLEVEREKMEYAEYIKRMEEMTKLTEMTGRKDQEVAEA